MKIASIIGVRPECIQCAPLLRELRKRHQTVLIHTGQHYDYEMNRVFFGDLQIPEPDHHLGVGSGTHGFQTGEMIKGIEQALIQEKPDLVLVYGDTNSTLAGALAAAKLQVRVGHVESGMRSFDRSMPEEINRILTDHCSDLLFCSTQTAVDNLRNEGIVKGVYLTGDVMADALLHNKEIAEKSGILGRLGLESKEYLVVTIHRQGNTDCEEKLRSIVGALCQIDETIVFPLHPRTEKFLKEYDLYNGLKEKVKLTKPLGYLDFLKLISHARKILTDSGGMQKEAYILGIPCVTLRENTEWVETVEAGWNTLVGADRERIVAVARDFWPDRARSNLFSQGACQRISEIITDSFT